MSCNFDDDFNKKLHKNFHSDTLHLHNMFLPWKEVVLISFHFRDHFSSLDPDCSQIEGFYHVTYKKIKVAEVLI